MMNSSHAIQYSALGGEAIGSALPPAARAAGRRAFTLIELVVVIGIIILVVAIAVPAIGPAMFSSQQTQMMQTLTSAINLAQVRAETQGGFAVRIEQAFKTDSYGYMVDAFNNSVPSGKFNGVPVYLPHQQIRFLRSGSSGGEQFYAPSLDDVIKLPTGVWLAPDYAISPGYAGLMPQYFDSAMKWPKSGNFQGLPYNPFENFCIAFDQRGFVTELRPFSGTMLPQPLVFTATDNYRYQDQTQTTPPPLSYSPVTDYLFPSARGVIMYDRKRLEAYGPDLAGKANYLARNGRTLYINRYLGTLVEGEAP